MNLGKEMIMDTYKVCTSFGHDNHRESKEVIFILCVFEGLRGDVDYLKVGVTKIVNRGGVGFDDFTGDETVESTVINPL